MRQTPVLILLALILCAGSGCFSIGGSTRTGGSWPAPAPAPDPEPTPSPAPRTPTRAADDVPVPVYWTWQPPLGRAADHPRIIQMVRINTDTRSAAKAADAIIRQIRERGLRPGEVAVVLQNFGSRGKQPLWHHPDDEIDGNHSVWHARGIAMCRAYMNDFIARYRAVQASDPALPDPSRFHFDNERPPAANREAAHATFVAMQSDRRWSREAIAGFGGQTLAQLYAAAGQPPVDPKQGYFRERNLDWARWFGSVALTSADAAMDAAAYEPIRAAWPACRSSNWWTSCGFDGADATRVMRWHGKGEYSYTSRPSADVQAPVLYWANDIDKQPGESDDAALIRTSFEKIEAVQRSYTTGAARRTNIAPWIELTGNRRKGLAVSPETQLTILKGLRERGIREFLIWSDANRGGAIQQWNAFHDIVTSID